MTRTSGLAFPPLPFARLLIDQSNSPHFRGYSTFKTETTFGKSDLRDQVSPFWTNAMPIAVPSSSLLLPCLS